MREGLSSPQILLAKKTKYKKWNVSIKNKQGFDSLSRPFPPDYLRERISWGETGEGGPLLAHRVGVVEQLLHSRPHDHLQVGLRLESARVVLRDAGVLPLVLPLQLESCQSPRGLVQFPALKSCFLVESLTQSSVGTINMQTLLQSRDHSSQGK